MKKKLSESQLAWNKKIEEQYKIKKLEDKKSKEIVKKIIKEQVKKINKHDEDYKSRYG